MNYSVNLLRASIILFLVYTLLAPDVECRKKGKKGNSVKDHIRHVKKQRIIQCCGRKSCHDFVFKVRPNSTTTISQKGATFVKNTQKPTSKIKIKKTTNSETTESELMTTTSIPISLSEIETTVMPPSEALETTSELTTVTTPKETTGTTFNLVSEQISSSSSSVESTLSSPQTSPPSETTTSTSSESTTSTTALSSTLVSSSSTSSILSSTSTSTSTTESSTTTTTTSTSTTTMTTTLTTTLNMKKPPTVATKQPLVLPICPLKCDKELSFFKTDGSLEDPDIHGFWSSACGELFLFGKVLVNWEQNVEACCKLGMKPISFETDTKKTCFNSFINGMNWKYNSRYWTYGLRSTPTSFKWCSTGGAVASTLWSSGQPNNVNQTENCAQMVVYKRDSRVLLEDRSCSIVSAVACQGPPTPAPPCVSPVCPTIDCKKNMNYFKILEDKKTSHILNPSVYGTWVHIDGKSYFFSLPTDKRTFTDALTACCAIGLKLVSLHQAFKYKVIPSALTNGSVQPSSFWTSATDQGCEDSFGYCTTNRLLRDEATWSPGQPDNLLGKENCVIVDVNATSALLSDVNCDATYQYICEGKTKSVPKSVEEECSIAYNLTSTQVQSLLVSFPETIQEKCFLKCYGEGTDMIINGKLVEEKVISQLFAISTGDVDKLLDMYDTFNFCSNLTRGMDICDKMSKLLQCGNVNSPEAVDQLIKILENSLTGEAPAIMPPVQAVCPNDYKCVIDDDLKHSFDRAPSGAVVQGPLFNGYVTHACGKKFLFNNLISGYNDFSTSVEKCCLFGLKLLTVETKEKLDCLVNVSAKLSPTPVLHAVAANRLGIMSKPTWCFNNKPVNFSWFVDQASANTVNVDIAINFKSPPIIGTFGVPFGQFACESL